MNNKIADWLQDNWLPFLAMIAIILMVFVTAWNYWASYQCVEAGFLGGTIYNFRVVCYVLWR